MKSVFSIGGDGEFPNAPHYDLAICFNGMPETVVIEVEETRHVADPASKICSAVKNTVVRSLLKPSQARAIASALLSAATEVKR